MKKTYINKIFLIFTASAILGFCIITNSSGDYRSYLPEDLPFVIQLNETTPSDFKPVVEQALLTWNNVEGSYFQFQLGSDTDANGVALDNINLLYFDAQNENFAEGSNTIAFSSTFTSNVGGYHAIESDYIYNAEGYPPATDGNSSQMDLWTITMHEVGHHMGLSHSGSDGNSNGAGSEGCGESLPSSIMYWSVGFGQIKRELDPHGEMGAVALYPNYEMEISITDLGTGDPLENTKIVLNDDAIATIVGPVESSLASGRGLRPGEVYTEIPTDGTGILNVVMNKPEFSFDVFKFGYHTVARQNVSFPEPFDFGDTQYLSYNFELQKSEVVELSGSLTSTTPEINFIGEVIASWVSDENESFTSVIDASGNFSIDLPEGNYYNVKIYLIPPYENVLTFDSIFVATGGLQLDLDISPTKLLLVNSEDTEIENYSIYIDALNKLGLRYSFWDEYTKGSISEQNFITEFSTPYTVIWNAGGESSSGLSESDYTFLENHLQAGNNLLLTGDNVAENTQDGNTFLNNYLGVKFFGNSEDGRLRGTQGDEIGNGYNAKFNASSKDLLQFTNTNLGEVNSSFYVGTTNIDTANIVGVRSEGPGTDGWRAFYMSAGIHHLAGKYLDTLFTRSIKYVLDTTFVTGVNTNLLDELPNIYSISQNYPNPFNPSTTIKFAIPVNANVTLKIFNILGEQVDVLKSGAMNAGSYELKWNAVNSSISSGIYFYRIEADGINGSKFAETKKMILLK